MKHSRRATTAFAAVLVLTCVRASNLDAQDSRDLLGHSGGTLGFDSRLVIDTTRKRAVIALVNGRSENGASELVGLALDRARLQ